MSLRLTTVFTSIKMITISDLEESDLCELVCAESKHWELTAASSFYASSPNITPPCPLFNPALSSGFQHVGIVNVAVSTKDGHKTWSILLQGDSICQLKLLKLIQPLSRHSCAFPAWSRYGRACKTQIKNPVMSKRNQLSPGETHTWKSISLISAAKPVLYRHVNTPTKTGSRTVLCLRVFQSSAAFCRLQLISIS